MGELGRIRKTGRGGAVYDLMESLRSLGVVAPSGASLPLSVGMAKIGRWREEDWFSEVSLLMDDAKKAGDKGFGVRKELLLMVGKKLGFIAPDVGDSLAGILSGIVGV